MLNRRMIVKLFKTLNAELKKMRVVGEVGICGGAVMCLVFNARKATKDVDAVFAPAKEMRRAAKAVAARLGLSEDWLNDAAKGFFGADPPRDAVLELPHLRVYAPRADYMLAMKCVAARFDSGLNFVKLLGLSGGMPTRVSVPRKRMAEVLAALGVSRDSIVPDV